MVFSTLVLWRLPEKFGHGARVARFYVLLPVFSRAPSKVRSIRGFLEASGHRYLNPIIPSRRSMQHPATSTHLLHNHQTRPPKFLVPFKFRLLEAAEGKDPSLVSKLAKASLFAEFSM